MSYTKKKFALWLTPGTKELVERCYQLDNSQSQSEFIERAIQFYTGYLEAEQDGTYLPVTLSAVLEGSLGALGDRLGKLLFKMSVEMSMMMHLSKSDRKSAAYRFISFPPQSAENGIMGKSSYSGSQA